MAMRVYVFIPLYAVRLVCLFEWIHIPANIYLSAVHTYILFDWDADAEAKGH